MSGTDTPTASAPRVSVIVPVYNHWHRVPALLACLDAQTLDTAQFELLLVDNGSDTPPTEQNWPHWICALECRTPGSYAARNWGIAQARAPLLAFTDADCQPAPDWLENLLHCFDTHNADAIIAGDIVVEPADWQHLTACELYDVALALPQARYVRRGYGVTANLAASKALLEKLGGFDARRYSGGDADFCRRASHIGVPLFYCEAARVIHPARRAWAELVKKSRRLKGGQIASGAWQQRMQFGMRTLLPPVFAWRRALAARRLTLPQRLKVCALQTGLWSIEMCELLRLLGGGAARRD